MLYIRAVLEKIHYSKQLFTFEIEDDAEVFIPQDLSQSGLPISFRYYDPLILMVQDHMSVERQSYFKNEEFNQERNLSSSRYRYFVHGINGIKRNEK
jgi:hypothetical protein